VVGYSKIVESRPRTIYGHEESLTIAKEAADAAKKSADVLPAIERAYLFAKVILDISDNDPDEIIRIGTNGIPGANRVKIIITNHGKTPAILKRITIFENDFFKGKFDIIWPFGTKLLNSGEQHIDFAHFFIHGNEEWNAIKTGVINLVCEGRVLYTDVWVISHDEIGFCWKYNELFDDFFPCQEYQRNYRRQTPD
jgi:hypothetical protein